ncbi:DUF4190 domain-containing protein [Nocardioides sp. R1-1]|uniref:DUF4190 domain-containing protein n=1 Tax=Nocardioides sp. R1-1 TaxID=3383502 RepID=UPI0038D0CBE6
MSYHERPPYGTPPPPPGGEPGGYTPYGGPGGYGGYGGPGAPGGYGPPGYGYQAPQQSVLAVVSLVAGIVGLVGVCCCGILGVVGLGGVICGILAKKEIRDAHGMKTGDGLALAGIITGALGIALGIASVILVFAVGAFDYSYYS